MPDAPRLFDRALIARHLERRPPGAGDFVMELVKDDLAERLAAVTRKFERALIMAPDARPLPQGGVSHEGSFAFARASTVIPAPGVPLVDPEALDLEHDDYDLVVSLLDLEIVNDVPGFLARVRAHMRADGLFLAATIGGDSLTELRAAALAAETALTGGAFARVAPFIPLADAAGLLQRARFAMPVADVELHTVRYDGAIALMGELKALGASNPLVERPGRPMTRGLLGAIAEAYAAASSDPDGRVRASLEILWLSGWVPDASQPRPARRGSATVSLAKVLGNKAKG